MRIWKYIFGLLSLVFASLSIAIYSNSDSKFHLIACDVGQGDAILAIYKNTEILVDSGPNDKVLDCLAKHMPFWDKKLELAVLTHPQLDHYGGFISVFKNYKVDIFMANAVDSSNDSYRLLKKMVGGSGTRLINPTTGQSVRLGKIYLDILHPAKAFLAGAGLIDDSSNSNVLGAFTSDRDPNDFSVNLILSYGNFDALLTGDIGPVAIPDLIKEGRVRQVEYLKVPHHGSKNGLTPELLELAKPQIAVISVGKNNRYGHPHQETLEMLKAQGIQTLRTDKNGDVEVVTDGKTWKAL